MKTNEKIYLHTDKSYYSAGDTIWFKGYTVTGSNHELSTISNVLNVELVNNRDSVKQIIKVLMLNGLCHGGLPLPDATHEGNYRIRAYTSWMRNAGEEYYFDKNIHIINPANFTATKPLNDLKSNNVSGKTPIQKVGIQFFPEGGSLVAGLDCKVAFKALNSNGLGVAINGTIVDEKGDSVTSFSSGKLGMGYFYLNAEAGKIYKAKIATASGYEINMVLPKASTVACALKVSQLGSDQLRIAAVPGPGANLTGGLTLIAKSGGVTYFEGKSRAGSNSLIATIDKKRFPTGIVQFTLLSASGEPLNERLIFVQHNDQLQLNIATEKQSYARQQKVKLQLAAKPMDGSEPIKGSFSVSVIDETRVPIVEAAESNILSNILLTSDLKGFVENPDYYFKSTDQKTKEDLDALMLTQGYRRFTWKQDVLYPADTGLTISGRLTKTSGKPVVNGKITMYSMDGGFAAFDTTTNNDGRFAFKNLYFADSTKFVLQSVEKERDRYQISVDMDKVKAIPNKNIPDLMLDNESDLIPLKQNSKALYTQELKSDYNRKARLLREVTVKDNMPKDFASPNSVLKGAHADYVVTGKQLMATKWGNTSDALIGLIPGLSYDKNHLLKKSLDPKAPPITVIVDGFVVNDINMTLPSDIESVEFVYKVGGGGLSGNLYITTKRGGADVVYSESLPGYIQFSPVGFSKVREFYSPQYDNPKVNREIADLRSTIYWNPTLITNKDGSASFEFFNAGGKGTYRVVVEGIDGEGRLGRAEYRYKVE